MNALGSVNNFNTWEAAKCKALLDTRECCRDDSLAPHYWRQCCHHKYRPKYRLCQVEKNFNSKSIPKRLWWPFRSPSIYGLGGCTYPTLPKHPPQPDLAKFSETRVHFFTGYRTAQKIVFSPGSVAWILALKLWSRHPKISTTYTKIHGFIVSLHFNLSSTFP